MEWIIRLIWIWRGTVVSRRARKAAARLRAALAAAPADFPARLREDVEAATARLEAPEVRIAVGGLFKAGKSTLLNAFLRDDVLPSSDLAETGAPAWLRPGRARRAEVRLADGSVEAIEPTRAAIASRTSIRVGDGRRRGVEALASRVEVWAPGLGIGRHAALIDVPGLNDRPEFTASALQVLRSADWVLWLFRSEPQFSEQDAESIAAFTPYVEAGRMTFVLNARLERDDDEAWSHFLRTRAPVAHEALRERAADMGFTEAPPAPLVVSARAIGAGGDGFGAAELRALLRQICGERARSLMRARFSVAGRLVEPAMAWLAAEGSTAQQRYDQEKAAHDAYVEAGRRHARLAVELKRRVEAAFGAMQRQLAPLPVRHASRVSLAYYREGEEFGPGLAAEAASIAVEAAATLAAEASQAARDLAGLDAGAARTAAIIRAFSPYDGDELAEMTPREVIAHVVEQWVGSLEAPDIDRSFLEKVKKLFGNDEAKQRAYEGLCTEIRHAAEHIGSALTARRAAVQAAVDEAFTPPPLAAVAPPNPARLNELNAFRTRLEAAAQSVAKGAGAPS